MVILNETMRELFGESIYEYTRKQAIEDDVLWDVTPQARQVGIIHPVALSTGVKALCESDEGNAKGVCRALSLAVARMKPSEDQSRVCFTWNNEELYAVCGPGDKGEPVITIMLIGED